MTKLIPQYQCHCAVPTPLVAPSPRDGSMEDTGLCQACDYVYDEGLYERRLRAYLPDYTFDSLHDFLAAASPTYQARAASQTA